MPPNWDTELGAAHELENVVLPARPTRFPGFAVAAPTNPPPRSTIHAAHHGGHRMVSAQSLGRAKRIWQCPRASAAADGGLHREDLIREFYGARRKLGRLLGPPRSAPRFSAAAGRRSDFLHALDIKGLARSRTVFRWSPANRLVVIDPGHGGSNTGTRNVVTGRYEGLHTRLGAALEAAAGTKRVAGDVDAHERWGDEAAQAGGVCRSAARESLSRLHFNATGDGRRPAGLETYLTPAGMPSSITRGYADDPRTVLPNNAYDGENLRYAVRLHRSLLRVNGNNDRGVRRAQFWMSWPDNSGRRCWIEAGYLSNPGKPGGSRMRNIAKNSLKPWQRRWNDVSKHILVTGGAGFIGSISSSNC